MKNKIQLTIAAILALATQAMSQKNNNGKISYSFSVSISSNEKTMSDKEIKIISEKIISTVSKKHEAVIRDQ